MGNATVEGNHVELDGVFVKRDALIHVKDNAERQITVGINVAPGDDSTVNEGLVVRFNDDIKHASHAQIQAVVGVNSARNRHLSLGQELFSVVDVKGEFGE